MGKFLQGLFLGTAIGLLIAPMRGEELRSKVRERFKQIQEKVSSSQARLRSDGVTRTNYTLPSSRKVDNEPITLPLNTSAGAKGAAMPSSTSSMNMPPSKATSQGANASTRQAPRTRLYQYESTLEEMDYEPLILPVETFEEIKAVKPAHERTHKRPPSSISTTNPNKNLSHQGRHNLNR